MERSGGDGGCRPVFVETTRTPVTGPARRVSRRSAGSAGGGTPIQWIAIPVILTRVAVNQLLNRSGPIRCPRGGCLGRSRALPGGRIGRGPDPGDRHVRDTV